MKNRVTQIAIAEAGGISLLIKLLDDHPEIHRDAAGALWSLASDAGNQKLIADEGGIPQLVELLKTGKKNLAQETAAGALHSLSGRLENRQIISEANGISLLVPLFEGGTDMAKAEVTGALLTLVIDNPANQMAIATKLVATIVNGPEAYEATNVAAMARVEAQEHATNVIYQLSLDRDNKEALQRTGSIAQLVRMLRGGTEKSQKVSADALGQITRMSTDLRIQVTTQVVTLLTNLNQDVRQRASKVLREMNEGKGDEVASKEAAVAAGVKPTVDLLKEGLKSNKVEAQEYALWSLSMTADAKRGVMMVKEGIIKPLINVLNGGKISAIAEQHANAVLSALALNKDCHEELIATGGIPPMVRLLEATSVGTRKFAATALARLAISKEAQAAIAEAGALKPLVEWLVPPKKEAPKDGETSPGSPKRRASKVGLPRRDSSGELDPSKLEQARSDTRSPSPEGRSPSPGLQKQPSASPMGEPSPKAVRRQSSMEDLPAVEDKPPIPPELKPVAALALADLARDNLELQAAISEAGAMKPLIIMTTSFKEPEAQKAAAGGARDSCGGQSRESNHDREGRRHLAAD